MLKSIILGFLCFQLVLCTSIRKTRSIAMTDVQEIHREENDRHVRREAGDSSMPDHIHVLFRRNGDDILLRLQRQPLLDAYHVTGDDQPATRIDAREENSAVYTDFGNQAAVRMTRSAEGGKMKMDGVFVHRGEPVEIKPSATSSKLHKNPHHVSPLLKTPPPLEVVARKFFKDSKKRQNIEKHVMETTFIIDHTDYAQFTSKFGNNADAKAREFYTLMSNQMNMLFATVILATGNLDIQFRCTQLVFIKNANNAITPLTGIVDGGIYADNITHWVNRQNRNDVPFNDVYLAFTALDISLHQDNSAVGVMTMYSVCKAHATGVCENKFNSELSNIAAHELGHALGSEHDGDGNNCPASANMIMDPNVNFPSNPPSNFYTFSSCSIQQFRNYLARNDIHCTTAGNTSRPNVLPFTGYDSDFVTDRNKQCRNLIGASSSFCDPAGFDMTLADICKNMLCSIGGDQCQFVLPFAGTPCGNNKVCIRGSCVNKPANPPATTVAAPTTQAPTNAPPAPTTAGGSCNCATNCDVCINQFYYDDQQDACCQSCLNTHYQNCPGFYYYY